MWEARPLRSSFGAAWCVLAVAVVGWCAEARAQDGAQERSYFGLGLELGVGLPLDSENADLFSVGLGGTAYGELNVLEWLGVHAGGGYYGYFPDGAQSGTDMIHVRGGLRAHWGTYLFAGGHDGWLDVHGTWAQSGSIKRGGFDLGVGLELRPAKGIRVGPFVRYQFLSDPDHEHAHVLTAGISLGFFGDPRTPVPAPPAPAPEVPADLDGDGVLNEEDVCPSEHRGARPDPARPGCPSSDADSDGVADSEDVCPMEPAGARPDPEMPGCPMRDADGDGVVDREDQCPDVPAGASPDPDRPGCPIGDRDGDGVMDNVDTCPERHHGPFPDEARPGCPEADRDADSVPDASDACPDEAGAPSRDPARNGCPGLVRVVGADLQILRPVFFETDSDVLQDRSADVLRAVAEAVQTLGIRRLRIEGHTDDRGTAEHNLDLSRRRSQAVLRWLVEHGVSPEGLEAVGYGESTPVAGNDTAEGRARNRRVDFRILDGGYGGSQ